MGVKQKTVQENNKPVVIFGLAHLVKMTERLRVLRRDFPLVLEVAVKK